MKNCLTDRQIDRMAPKFALKCNYIYLLILIVFAWQLCAAKQLPLPANVAAAASAATTTAKTTPTRTSSSSSSSSSAQQLRHESYDIDDDNIADAHMAPSRRRRQVSDWFIAPNTRWCGRGNLANGTYNHLGGASLADKCCRKHDHCKIYIPAMSNRYELFNYRPYTLSHCSCDRRFRTCLKMASDEDANTIGKLFFNMVQTQCFVLKTEKVCQQRGTGIDSDKCLREVVSHKAYLKNNKKF
ncbi:phospholipase A2 hemilipin [Drosophila novamexicana]|uniref:phospholipase A2 hemilipin n=1 Tax=Drosophila novamexicana TaxID=47314 RepID=UPI0011E58948|nr:phospholipase A2 hemilipin [Drosophila novamexicana]